MADGMFTVEVDGALKAMRDISRLYSRESLRGMNEHVGVYLTEKLKDFIGDMSISRHKTADRLGAIHTGYFENATGRTGDGRQTTELGKADDKKIEIVIRNTPGLKRAYGPMDIRPRKAKALTIPLARESYGKTVAEMKSAGHVLVRIWDKEKGRGILAEKVSTPARKGRKGRKGANAATAQKEEMRPMYALVKHVRIPQDRGLLPTDRDFALWAADAVEGWELSVKSMEG